MMRVLSEPLQLERLQGGWRHGRSGSVDGRSVDAVDTIVLVGPAMRVAEVAHIFLRTGLYRGHVADTTDKPAKASHDAGEGGLQVGRGGGGGRRVA